MPSKSSESEPTDASFVCDSWRSCSNISITIPDNVVVRDHAIGLFVCLYICVQHAQKVQFDKSRHTNTRQCATIFTLPNFVERNREKQRLRL